MAHGSWSKYSNAHRFYVFNFNVLRELYEVFEVPLVSQRGAIIVIVLVKFEINSKSVYGGD